MLAPELHAAHSLGAQQFLASLLRPTAVPPEFPRSRGAMFRHPTHLSLPALCAGPLPLPPRMTRAERAK
jgi:hypothetical protein